jgi:hypothetical protein
MGTGRVRGLMLRVGDCGMFELCVYAIITVIEEFRDVFALGCVSGVVIDSVWIVGYMLTYG